MAVYIIIPARFQSTRFPGKVLADIKGKPMIQHVYERACEADVGRVIIATDDQRVMDVVKGFNGTACMTADTHQSGTERLAEAIDKLGLDDDDIVVNLQGDEPFIPPSIIRQVTKNLEERPAISVTTLCEPIDSLDDLFNLNINKVVMDEKGCAIYFSHTPIPWYRDGFKEDKKELPKDYTYYRHIGIYAYHAGFVKRYVNWSPSPIEKLEALEQLRVLWYGEKIHVDIACEKSGIGIDTPEDLAKIL